MTPRKIHSVKFQSDMDVSFNVHTTLGALLIGLFISCCLFGVSTTQTYMYYTRFPKDSIWLKIMVCPFRFRKENILNFEIVFE